MKRLIYITLMLLTAAVCRAASPLESEKIFDRDDLRTEGHSIVKVSNPSNYFRSITAENDKKLLKDVKKAIEQDRKQAFNVVERYDGDSDEDYIILNINKNEYVVNIGFYWNDNGYVRLFIQSDPRAFK